MEARSKQLKFNSKLEKQLVNKERALLRKVRWKDEIEDLTLANHVFDAFNSPEDKEE